MFLDATDEICTKGLRSIQSIQLFIGRQQLLLLQHTNPTEHKASEIMKIDFKQQLRPLNHFSITFIRVYL